MLLKPFLIVAALIGMLTYLYSKSRTADQGARTRMQGALQAVQLCDAELNRDVLMARAGLLPNYDSLPRTAARLSRAIDALRTESESLHPGDRAGVDREVTALTAALKDKLLLIECLKTDTTRLRNSMAYFAHSMRGLDLRGETGRPAMAAAALAHVMLRFVYPPDPTARREAERALERLSETIAQRGDVDTLSVHGRTIVEALPRVDGLLTKILASGTETRSEALQQSILEYSALSERHAQRFRLLLYLVALTLLGYVLYQFASLRVRARELRRKEIQLIQSNKMAALGMLVSGVAHEVNNPNQVVLMNSGVLAAAWDDAADVLDNHRSDGNTFSVAGLPYDELRETMPLLIAGIGDAARKIDRIIGDLKDFARPSTRANQTFQLNDIVQRALRLLTHVIQKKTESLELRLAGDLPPLHGNPQHIEQVAVNLIINALESLPSRRSCVTVSTSFSPSDELLVLEVQDDGVGIPQENLARLGEPFFSTKESTGGTGLGLAIAFSLVRAHGGRLSFKSVLRKGTCAKVEFPCPRCR